MNGVPINSKFNFWGKKREILGYVTHLWIDIRNRGHVNPPPSDFVSNFLYLFGVK